MTCAKPVTHLWRGNGLWCGPMRLNDSTTSDPCLTTCPRCLEVTHNAATPCQCGHRRDEHKDWFRGAACKKCGCLMFKLPDRAT